MKGKWIMENKKITGFDYLWCALYVCAAFALEFLLVFIEGIWGIDINHALDFDVTPHLLRHTYITNLIYQGVDPKTVQYLAGHENNKVTMDIYAKVKYNKPTELISVVNAALGQVT